MKTISPALPLGPVDATGEDDTARRRGDATELARQDGRTEARDVDRAEAVREQTAPTAVFSQEVPAGDETLVTWDISSDETGHRTPEAISDDEADVSADQAEEGSGEAEQELRRAAAEVPPRSRAPHE